MSHNACAQIINIEYQMRKIIVLAMAVFITACQQTPDTTTVTPITNDYENSELAVNSASHDVDDISADTIVMTKPKLPHEHEDVWQRIRSQLSIEVPDHPAVNKWRKYYLKHPNFMVTIAKRAEPFLYYIVQEIEARNIPVELALLPIVESSYIPYGVSHMSATGLWQFMPVSATRFNVEQNWWFEGRRDIVQSTRAALDYFEFFHRSLGQDWLNAIAAFNSGEGRVGRAIKRNKKDNLDTDFWSLQLPSETTEFVPKLLAIADILKHADALNYTFTPIRNQPAVEIVEVEGQLDISLAAQWANITPKELLLLNPGLKRWATAPNTNYKIMLPVNSAPSFKEKLATTDKKDWLRWDRYKVKSGDSLSKIASVYTINVAEIKKLNKLKSDRIRIGQMLIVPYNKDDVHAWLHTNRFTKKLTHTVRSGDNLWDISRKYKVSVKDIVRWNKLAKNSLLQPKQKLAILL